MWPWQRRSALTGSAFSMSDLVEAAKQIRESLEGGLLEEDSQWVRAGTTGEALSETDRIEVVRQSRHWAMRDGLSKQIVRLWLNYGIGLGATWDSKEDKVSSIIKPVWNDRRNRSVFTTKGQRELGRSFLVDGEVFIVGFGKDPVVWRRIDSTEIEAIATDPEDKYSKRYYVRRTSNGGTTIYRDAFYYGDDPGVTDSGTTVESKDARTDSVMIHSSNEVCSGRGIPLLVASIEWARSHRRFMRGRVAIQEELSRIARRVKVKGGPERVDAVKARMEAARAARRSKTNDSAMATTRIENENEQMENMGFDTGAGAAQVDGSMLLQISGVGAGIFPHYLGGGEAFRLATADAMESPMLTSFSAYQDDIKSLYRDMFDYVLMSAGVDVEKAENLYTLELPDVFMLNSPASIAVIEGLVRSFPKLSESDTLAVYAMSRVGVKDPQRVMEEVKALPPKPPAIPEAPAKPLPPTAEESVDDLVTMLLAMRRYEDELHAGD